MKHSNKFLKGIQKRANQANFTIKFVEEVPKMTLEKLIEYAITQKQLLSFGRWYRFYMPDTIKAGVKKYKTSQDLGSTRSLFDLYLICKHYYPKTTIFEIRDILQSFKDEGNLHAHYCITRNRMMFRFGKPEAYETNSNLRNYGIE